MFGYLLSGNILSDRRAENFSRRKKKKKALRKRSQGLLTASINTFFRSVAGGKSYSAPEQTFLKRSRCAIGGLLCFSGDAVRWAG